MYLSLSISLSLSVRACVFEIQIFIFQEQSCNFLSFEGLPGDTKHPFFVGKRERCLKQTARRFGSFGCASRELGRCHWAGYADSESDKNSFGTCFSGFLVVIPLGISDPKISQKIVMPMFTSSFSGEGMFGNVPTCTPRRQPSQRVRPWPRNWRWSFEVTFWKLKPMRHPVNMRS